ncbi:MAG: ribosomal protein S18-alanine N-acetyltransferase [Desulfuromonadales bacterium]|nr:ribosomal protein S18-alanine N-acetyltransferase [Desulfuromonadales bacterium]NIR34185.1 ribosomal protein S18-alanine N-acetyltransferase [Desulfuromonadales bacterium]NIS41632.1 ribosomal protein S18-alanine N-acetyltransferase [Desulfuromonadales bacterium]
MNEARRIAPFELADMDALLAVERACNPNPWSRDLFMREYDNPRSSLDLLWDGEEALAGYLVSWYLHGELQIMNVATAPAFRRQGVGRSLLRHAMARARQRGLERTTLEVRTGNAGAIALYEALGFRRDAVRRRYYVDGEDALLMSREEVAGPAVRST